MAEEYIKGSGTGRGGWRGGGRPKGSTKEKVKKKFSFRLSEEEEKAVRQLLAKMRGKLIILFCMISLALPTFAFEYTIDTAREEAFKGIPKYCVFPDTNAFHRSVSLSERDETSIISKQSRTDNPAILDVIYKETPAYTYTYRYQKPTLGLIGGYQGLIVSVNYQTDKAIKKIASYQAFTGRLMMVALDVSAQEAYIFDMDGNLLGSILGNERKQYKIPYSTVSKLRVINSGL